VENATKIMLPMLKCHTNNDCHILIGKIDFFEVEISISPYNFEGTGPILGVKNRLQRVNGHAAYSQCPVSLIGASSGKYPYLKKTGI
jgi:hypothetical protein